MEKENRLSIIVFLSMVIAMFAGGLIGNISSHPKIGMCVGVTVGFIMGSIIGSLKKKAKKK
jgi:uncharacterized membrane protein